MTNERKRYILLGAGLAVIMLIFIGVNYGTNRQSTATTVELDVADAGSSVYADNRLVTVTETDGQKVTMKNLKPGKHSIIVSKEGYWPWSKEITLSGGDTFELTTFAVANPSQQTELVQGDPKYSPALGKIVQKPFPTADKRLASNNGEVELWIDDNEIVVEWVADRRPENFFCTEERCQSRRRVIEPITPIRDVAFYDERPDVVLFAAGDSIYAIEIDIKGTQNFQPVYKGTAPRFDNAGSDSIYVFDQGKVYEVAT